MASNSAKIDRLRIATPCPISWEQMTGDTRIRFCDHCQLHVYNISELSRIEAESLIASTEGRLCARLFRRADGTILTNDCPVGLRALRKRVSKRAAALFATIAGISGAVFGQQSAAKEGKTACTPQVRITRTNVSSDASTKVLSGTVLDPNGVLVPGAQVTLLIAGTKDTKTVATNDAGRFEFASLPTGTYSITVKQTGFKSLEIKDVSVEKDKSTNLDLILEPASDGQIMGIVSIGEPSLIANPPGTTIFNERMIRSLPLPK
jgi:hypothetical protein